MSMDLMAEARAERLELVEFLRGITAEQWQQPSLCSHWSVQDVVAHLVSYEVLTPVGVLTRAATGLMSLNRMNAIGVAEHSAQGPDQLMALLQRHATPSGITALRGGGIGLVDSLIHQQDIRRPLGSRRDIPMDRLRYALDFARTAPPLRGLWRIRGVRLVATDAEWAAGRGPEARGPAEAALMVMAGRPGAAEELTGPGREVLVRRFG